MSIGNHSDPKRIAQYCVARTILENGGKIPTREVVEKYCKPLGVSNYDEVLGLAIRSYEEDYNLQEMLRNNKDVSDILSKLFPEHKNRPSKEIRPITLDRPEPFLSRPILAVRQWWRDIKESTRPM